MTPPPPPPPELVVELHVGEPAVRNALSVGIASAIIPGFGQIMQHRYRTAALQVASVAAYLLGASQVGDHRWAWGAVLVNLWSVIDAV